MLATPSRALTQRFPPALVGPDQQKRILSVAELAEQQFGCPPPAVSKVTVALRLLDCTSCCVNRTFIH